MSPLHTVKTVALASVFALHQKTRRQHGRPYESPAGRHVHDAVTMDRLPEPATK